jgi:BirA family biotin operon repressor/biotin-[acetyl-CoA-carboxylase] ligase
MDAALPWTIHRRDEVASTNDDALALPPWNAVVARRQTSGRGRYDRVWVSDEGGLWLTAVVPTPGSPVRWRGLPLATGLAIRRALISLGVSAVRLRWPNDLMVRGRKLAGILVDQSGRETAAVGIGINVTNDPGARDHELSANAITLAQCLVPNPPPCLEVLTASILNRLGEAHALFAEHGIEGLLDELNLAWDGPRPVRLALASGHDLRGTFLGVDGEGRVLVAVVPSASPEAIEPHTILKLRET